MSGKAHPTWDEIRRMAAATSAAGHRKDPSAQGRPRHPGENRARAQRREQRKAAAA